MRPARIYLSAPDISGRERALVAEAFDANWIAPVGPHIDAFEQEFSRRIGATQACALSSGTAGLHLSLILAGIGPGDVVAVSSFTFVATANPVRYVGAEPVFIDSERATWCMDPKRLADAFHGQARAGRPIKAVIVVHLYGQSAQIKDLQEVCAEAGAVLIEDAAESLGSTYGDRCTGLFGDFGVYSFNGNKIITTSGGGMLVARNSEKVSMAKFLSTQAKDPGGYYRHSSLGFNYRMSNVCAGIGRGQLEQLDAKIERRRSIAARYEAELAGVPGVDFMREYPNGRSNRWLSTLVLEPGAVRIPRDTLVVEMERRNIECRPVWVPLHQQPLYRDCTCYGRLVSEELAGKSLNLPSGSGMSDADQARVIDALRELLA